MQTSQRQALETARIAMAVQLPSGADGDKRVQLGEQWVTPVYSLDISSDGEGQRTDLGTLPLRTKELYVQQRMCGDYYCFIHADRQVAATGHTRSEAFRNALAKVQA